ncbi:MAG: hypothetical protein KAI24_10720, partial [Planctomycetes bacterium]|nr:hypothetical protein [Planctomycetota bacterium]
SIWVGVTEWFHVYDGWREVVECGLKGDAAVPQKQFVWGGGGELDELVGYRHKDVYGSQPTLQWSSYHVVQGSQDKASVLLDEVGSVVERCEYSPYGRVSVYVGGAGVGQMVSSVGMPFLWKGLRLDVVTGDIYMRNRFYEAALGRFSTRDRLGAWFDGANHGNAHAYAGDRPASLADPFGLASCAACGPVRLGVGEGGGEPTGVLPANDVEASPAACRVCGGEAGDGGLKDAGWEMLQVFDEQHWCFVHCLLHAGLTQTMGFNVSFGKSFFWEIIETAVARLPIQEPVFDVLYCDRMGDMAPPGPLAYTGCLHAAGYHDRAQAFGNLVSAGNMIIKAQKALRGLKGLFGK